MVIHTSIPTETVINKGFRLDAGAYEIKNIEILNKIKNSRYKKVKLVGESGLSLADYPLRFKRTFCSKSQGLPIYQPSKILEIKLNEQVAILDVQCDRRTTTVSYAKDMDLLRVEQKCIENLEAEMIRITTLENEVKALKEELKANRSFGELWRGLFLMAVVFLVAVAGAAIFRHIA